MGIWPTLAEWDAWPDARKEGHAKWISTVHFLKPTFAGLHEFSLGSQHRKMALFQGTDVSLVFVPGGPVPLGFDASAFTPTPEQLDSYRRSAEEYGFEEDLRGFLDTGLRSPETSTIKPLLVEREAREIGLEPIAADHPDVQQVLKKHGHRSIEVEGRLRVRRHPDGSISAWRIVARTHSDIVGALKRDGFRLPSADEWEHLCAGGARTLFRWGDACPCDRYPTDVPSKQNGLTDWSLHRQPNAFGLSIASDPYQYEIVNEADQLRGGDGGSNVCGGAGYFLGWLPLAAAFIDPAQEEDSPEEDRTGHFMRRVLPLD